jgi:tetratricopeptide (TPR) repeat protein
MPHQQLLAAADRSLENGRTHRAEELYREALADRPGDPAALTGLAYIHLDRGRIPDAVSAFKQALTRDEGYAPALFGLGEAYREQGRRDLAVRAFKAYLARDPSGRDAGAASRQIQQLSP